MNDTPSSIQLLQSRDWLQFTVNSDTVNWLQFTVISVQDSRQFSWIHWEKYGVLCYPGPAGHDIQCET